ncbi:MAG: acyl-CoA thioesterase [Acidilobaceae archaeon]
MSEDCPKTLSPSDTVVQVVRQVNPGHANPLGIMHGGYMLEWIIDVATLQAMRVSRGYAVTACMEDMIFIAPVRVGSLVVMTSWVEFIGKSSVEVSILVETEDPSSGEKALATYSSLTMVAVDEKLKPRPVKACIKPREDFEKELVEAAVKRRGEREARIGGRKLEVSQIEPPRAVNEGH